MGEEKRFQLQTGVRVLCAGLFFVLASAVFSQDSDLTEADEEATAEEPLELDRLRVTGSHIRRVDTEGALPVAVIDREMIDRSGKTSMADVLRNLSFNSFGSYRSSYDGNSRGSSEIDLRGLGAGRSLVLIDGRRMAKFPGSTIGQNLNNIPLGSVERIEVLLDGASAIYGSDAIAGVVNIITRKNYSGWEFMFGHADPEWGEGSRDQASVMWGHYGERSNLLFTLAWNRKELSMDRDFPDYEPGASWYANNFDITDPNFGFPYFAMTAIPGGCSDSEAFFLVPDEGSLSGELCMYDWARVAAQETSEENPGLLLKYEFELNERWNLWARASASRAEVFGQYAPRPWWSLWDDRPMPADSSNNPTNPYSNLYDPSFGPNVPVHWVHRFESLGTRDLEIETDLVDAQFGFTGWAGPVELDFGVRYSWNQTEQVNRNMLLEEEMYRAIEDGSYDLQSPSATPRAILDAMKTDYWANVELNQGELFLTANLDWLETAAGPVQWAFGGEYRQEKYRTETNWPDPPGPGADRDTTSLFFETLVPLLASLDLTMAGRWDDYSDWGSRFSPKVSLRWRPHETLVARGSWGEGFRAPQLILNSYEPWDFYDWTNQDDASCAALGQEPGCWVVFQGTFTNSDTLGAETSEQYSLGLLWDPADWFSMTLDYYDITIEDEINVFGWYHMLQMDWLGIPPPSGLGVERSPEGLLLWITHGWGNKGLVETSGADLDARLNFELGPGQWRSNLQLSRVFDYRFQILDHMSPNVVGMPEVPELRVVLSNYYDIGPYGFSWIINYISEQSVITVDGWEREASVPSWTSHDLQLSWRTPWNGRLTLGAQNVTSEKPATGESFGRDGYRYNYQLYDFYGRVLYVNYTQAFN